MTARWILAFAGLLGLTALSVFGYLQDSPEGPVASIHRQGHTPIQITREVVAAWAFIGAGMIAWHRRSATVVGPLMITVGAALLLKGLQYLPTSPLTSIGVWLGSGAGLAGVLLGVLILAYPSGDLRSRFERAWIGLGGVYLLILLAGALVTPGRRGNCECRSPMILIYDDTLQIELVNIADLFFAGMAALLVARLIVRWMTASPPARRAVSPVWLAGAVIMIVAVTGASFWSLARLGIFSFQASVPSIGAVVWGDRDPVVWEVLPWVQSFSYLLVPIALLWGLLRMRLRHSAVAGLAIDLGRIGGASSLTGALRKATGDPSLEVAFWSRPASAYVTQAGEPMTLPDDPDRRRVTILHGDDGPLAALIHDPALADQRSLVDGVAAVARLAIENERLHAEVKAQLEEVRASRERIVRAADDERRRVERNIHDGAQQRLVSLSLALTMAQAQMRSASPEVAITLAEAEAELKRAIGELRELARGIHPAILGEAGLTMALEALAERSPVPVTVSSGVTHRLSPLVEATAYFVAAEALTNIAKYAAASAIQLSAEESDGWLHLTISDDGVGGADPERGTGLRGLLDRVAAVGGRLSIDSLAGRGTRLVADIPCA